MPVHTAEMSQYIEQGITRGQILVDGPGAIDIPGFYVFTQDDQPGRMVNLGITQDDGTDAGIPDGPAGLHRRK